MKTIRLVIGTALLLLMITANAQDKKIAVVTFYVDKYINADKIVEEARSQTYEMTKNDDPRFDLRPVLQEFHTHFLEDYARKFPFEIIEEDKVLNHPKYIAYSGLDGVEDADDQDSLEEEITDRFIAIDGYNVLLTGGNLLRSWRTESHMVKILEDLDVDGVMFVSMYYQWEPKVALGGLGNAGIRAFINVDLYNKEAKKVFSMTEYATSKKGVALINGIPVLDYKKLMPLCENATEELQDDLDKKLAKLVNKVDKKL
ncbi:hypothetical protein [Fulvivirga sedimenti]|uniref:GLPGLI family protein n=1 Tax=Fulvivirga sedimenti TaxID=2879465 RepID=A0A9X1HKV9_9BACT|nr:hypothetical protein [Fulvivirga sedimenti]MCA6073761.1 hypothetical protein [Fulvivirga sedimenti]